MQAAMEADTVVIGGGFYGTAIAIYLARERQLKRVVLLEQESALLTRASYNNQARVHNGYHYPRSFTTAFRSRMNLARFISDWPHAVKQDFTKLYAIARRNSKVTSRQFVRFCHDIGASIAPANTALKALFSPVLIEDVFLVQEYAFDATKLADWARHELKRAGITVLYNTTATAILRTQHTPLTVVAEQHNGNTLTLGCRNVMNCTYSGLDQLAGDFSGTTTALKHEITEMALLQLPPILRNLGITVMDGPFFSVMPFPARKLHTLSHVRYTPHCSWTSRRGINPYADMAAYERESRANRMIRDVARYLPAIAKATYRDSLFEVKTVLVKNEGDDGRPILFEKYNDLPGVYSVLGGKIDNIYDVLEKLDAELFSPLETRP